MTSPLSMLSNLVGMVKNQSSDVSTSAKQNADAGSFGFENMESMGAEFTALLKNKLGGGDSASQEAASQGLAQQLASLPAPIAEVLSKINADKPSEQAIDGELIDEVASDISNPETTSTPTKASEFDANVKFVSLAGMPKPLSNLNEIHQAQIPEEYVAKQESSKTDAVISAEVELQPLDIKRNDGFHTVSFEEAQGAQSNQAQLEDGFNYAVNSAENNIVESSTAEQAAQGDVQVQTQVQNQHAVKQYQSVSQDQHSAYNHASRPRITLTSPSALQNSLPTQAPLHDGSVTSPSNLPAQAPVLEQNFAPSSDTTSSGFAGVDIPVSDKLNFPTEAQLSQQFDSGKATQAPTSHSFGQVSTPTTQGEATPQALDDILSNTPKTEMLNDALKASISEKPSATFASNIASSTGADVDVTKNIKSKPLSNGAAFASGNTSMADALANAKTDGSVSLKNALGEHADMVEDIEFTMAPSEAGDSTLATSGWNNSNSITSSVDASQLAATSVAGIDTTVSTSIKDVGASNINTSLSMFSSAAEGIGEQVVEGVQYGIQNGQKTLNMKLNPHTMGDVRIMLSSDANSHVTARFITNNNDANEQLQNQMNSLRESLEAQGVTINKISVEMASGNADNNTQFNGDESWQQQTANQHSQQQHNGQEQQDNPAAQMYFNANSQHNTQHQAGASSNASSSSSDSIASVASQNTPTDTSNVNLDGDISILA